MLDWKRHPIKRRFAERSRGRKGRRGGWRSYIHALQLGPTAMAGQVLNPIFESLAPHGSAINIDFAGRHACSFTFKYYLDNAMFRLSVPNSASLVDWARENRQGIAYVEFSEAQNSLYFEILKPGQLMEDILHRSLALGTWGRTSKRLYGWC